MKDSVLVFEKDFCAVCGKPNPQRHHVFHGTANRKLADEDGFWVPLCMEHHTGRYGVHNNSHFDLMLKQTAQRHYEDTHSREDFIRRYGKSYL